jgi:Coenzyme PQQ synthesis protein D (PqqD)
MNMDSEFVIPPQVRAHMVGEELVLLHLESGTYFGLDPVGARVWQFVRAGKSLSQACDAMVEEYDVSREVLEQDVLALACDLVDKKLVSVAQTRQV